MTEPAEDGMWDLAPPNTPLNTEWPPLEKTSVPPTRSKKANGWKKWKKKKKALAAEVMKEAERAQSLEQSLMVTPEEHDKLMQLATIFDRLELSAIISVLRGFNGDMTTAIDQCLVLTQHMEIEEARTKSNDSSSFSSSEDDSLSEEEESVSSSAVSLKNPEQTMERSQIFSMLDSDLQLEDFEELAQEDDDDENEQEAQEEDAEESKTNDEDEDLNSWSQGSLESSSPLPDENDDYKSKEQKPTNPTESFTVMGEYFELPSIPAQDSEVEKWLKEFNPSHLLRKSGDSLSESASIRESEALLDSSAFSGLHSQAILGDSDRLEEPSHTFVEGLDSEIPELVTFDSQYLFELEERTKPQCSVTQSVVSVGIDPQEQPETVSLQYHEKKVAELVAAKAQVEDEKKKAMTWCIEQIRHVTEENKEKDSIIERQTQEIERQKLEIEKLTKQLDGMKAEESKSEENELHQLFVASKEMIVEGVQSLQQNISKGIAKVDTDWVVLEKVKEFEMIEKIKDFDLVEKVKKMASSIKEEISSAFSNLEASVQKAVNSRSREPANAEQQLAYEEDKMLWMAEKASLESYIQELEDRIKLLKEDAQMEEKATEVKETQVDKVEMEAQGTNTVSLGSSVGSQTNSSLSDYGESYRFFQQEYRQLWDRQPDAFSFEEE